MLAPDMELHSKKMREFIAIKTFDTFMQILLRRTSNKNIICNTKMIL